MTEFLSTRNADSQDFCVTPCGISTKSIAEAWPNADGWIVNVERDWSRDEIRRRWRRTLPYPVAVSVAGTVATYFLSDFATAILVGVTLMFCTLAGAALALRLSYWYGELMNRPWGRR